MFTRPQAPATHTTPHNTPHTTTQIRHNPSASIVIRGMSCGGESWM